MTNDAIALIRSIAEERGRNIEWAEKAVRESAAITATDALDLKVIDLIASDIDTLLKEIDGRTVKLSSSEITLETHNAVIVRFEMDWREKLFNRISDPNIAYILMLLGIYGLIYELSNPSAIIPGVVGIICLLLAFFAFQTLPINAVGVLLIVFGIIMLLLEIKVPSYGILTIGGATSLLLGSLMLIDTTIPALKVSIGVIIPSVVATVLFAVFAVGLGLRAQSLKTATGREGLIGKIGETIEDLDPRGKVFVNGEYWIAKTKGKIAQGKTIRVINMRGLILIVEPESSEVL